MKKNKLKMIKKIGKLSLVFGLLMGLVFMWWIFNKQLRSVERNFEVTFVSPHQAIVFWKTESQSIGYLKSGEKKYPRQTKTYQTSSEASNIHAVFLENIPATGLYISLHNDDDHPLYLAEIIYIDYQPTDLKIKP